MDDPKMQKVQSAETSISYQSTLRHILQGLSVKSALSNSSLSWPLMLMCLIQKSCISRFRSSRSQVFAGRLSQVCNVFILMINQFVEVKLLDSSETSVATSRHSITDFNLQPYRCDNLTYCVLQLPLILISTINSKCVITKPVYFW